MSKLHRTTVLVFIAMCLRVYGSCIDAICLHAAVYLGHSWATLRRQGQIWQVEPSAVVSIIMINLLGFHSVVFALQRVKESTKSLWSYINSQVAIVTQPGSHCDTVR